MDAPPIQYCRTEDGLSIAYQRFGSGPPLIVTPDSPYSHIAEEAQIPWVWDWFSALAQSSEVIRFDGRGSGLSTRNPAGVSLGERERDLQAVIDHTGLRKFALFGRIWYSPLAIRFAAEQPTLVNALILWWGLARGEDLASGEGVKALLAMGENDPMLLARLVARGIAAPGSAAPPDLRGWVDWDWVYRMHVEGYPGDDATEALAHVRCPTLVLNSMTSEFHQAEMGQEVAAAIPNAKLEELGGQSSWPWSENAEASLTTIQGFLADSDAERSGAGL